MEDNHMSGNAAHATQAWSVVVAEEKGVPLLVSVMTTPPKPKTTVLTTTMPLPLCA